MDREYEITKLEEAFSRLMEGANALELMIQGLVQVQDPYAKGFCAFCVYFKESVSETQQLLEKLSAAKA